MFNVFKCVLATTLFCSLVSGCAQQASSSLEAQTATPKQPQAGVQSALAPSAQTPVQLDLPASHEVQVWSINSLAKIGGHTVSVLGNPQPVINSALGEVIRFDGDGDRLLVANNPLGDATSFTIEVLLKPADVFPNNWEPRFFHIEALDNPNRRVTMELRLNNKHQWYLDAYIKSDKGQLALIDSTKVHPVGQWAHAAITYTQGQFTTFVNGKKELQGKVEYLPIAKNAPTSLGARMNQVYWFNGELAQVAITQKVLAADQFLLLKKLPQ